MAADLKLQTRHSQLCDEERRLSRFDLVKAKWKGRMCITCASRVGESTHSMASPPLIVASSSDKML